MPRRRGVLAALVVALFILSDAEAQSPCDPKLNEALRRGVAQLESKLAATERALEQERTTSKRLGELLAAKDASFDELDAKCKPLPEQIADLKAEVRMMKKQQDEDAARVQETQLEEMDLLKSKLNGIIDGLKQELNTADADASAQTQKHAEMETALQACETTRNASSQAQQQRLAELERSLKAVQASARERAGLVETLQTKMDDCVRRLEDPDLVDWAAKRLRKSQEDSIKSVEAAKNKTLFFLAPLEYAFDWLGGMRRATSIKVANVMGSDEDSVDSWISHVLVLLGVLGFFFAARRSRFDLERVVVLLALYQSVLCAVLYFASMRLGINALQSVLGWSHFGHDALLLLLGCFEIVYWVLVVLVTLRSWLLRDWGSLRLRHVVQVLLATYVIVDFHGKYWSPAMVDMDGVAPFDKDNYAKYGVAYLALMLCLALGRRDICFVVVRGGDRRGDGCKRAECRIRHFGLEFKKGSQKEQA